MNTTEWFENKDGLTVKEIVRLEGDYRIDSLVCAIEAKLIDKKDNDLDINAEEFVVLAVESMEREVNNGGFSQFFSNDSWRFTPYLVDCLAAIGSVKAKDIASQAVSILGLPPLAEDTDVKQYFNGLQEKLEDDAITEKLEGTDSEYYQMDEDIAGLVFEFVKGNINCFE